jgi:phosphoribosylamine--glycine ligase
MWFDDNEQNKLFAATIGKLTSFLQHSQFRGDIDINCIINEEGIFPLEITARFGYPALHGSCALTSSPFGDFLKTVAAGSAPNMHYHKAFGIVIQVVVPLFPYRVVNEKYNPEGLKIYFTDSVTQEDMNHIHFNDVCLRSNKDGAREYSIAASHGYVMCVTGIGNTVDAARHKAYSLIDKIVVPKMFYRNDIGMKFIERDQHMLQEWGWL